MAETFITHVDRHNFDREVRQAKGPLLVALCADWMPSSRALDPVLERFARDNLGRVKVVRIDATPLDSPAGQSGYFGRHGFPCVITMRSGSCILAGAGASLSAAHLDELARHSFPELPQPPPTVRPRGFNL